MTSQCIKLLDVIKKVTTLLYDDDVIEFEFDSKRLKRICAALNIENPKKRATEIINSTEIDTQLQEHEAFSSSVSFNIEYDRKRMFEGIFNEYPVDELLKIKEQDILDVEYDNGLPTKIRFRQLVYPIYSLSFMTVIKEVRFGHKGDYTYNQEDYLETQKFLLSKGYDIPENIFQTHYFFVYLYDFLPAPYVESCFPGNYDEVLSGVFSVIDMIQHFNGLKTANFYDTLSKFSIKSIDELDTETLNKIMTDYWIPWGPGPCRGCITIKDYHCDADNAGILYNKDLKRHMGAYHSNIDGTYFFRSAPDYINNELSQPHTLLLLATFRTYINDNNVSVDDGIEYEIIENKWGPNIDYWLYIITKGFECENILDMDDHREILAERLGLSINEIDEQHPGFTQGWLRALRW